MDSNSNSYTRALNSLFATSRLEHNVMSLTRLRCLTFLRASHSAIKLFFKAPNRLIEEDNQLMKEVHAGGRWPLTGYATTSSKFSFQAILYLARVTATKKRATIEYILLCPSPPSAWERLLVRMIYLCEIEEWIRGQLIPFPESIDEMEWEALPY